MLRTRLLAVLALVVSVAVSYAQEAVPGPQALAGLSPEKIMALADAWGMNAALNGLQVWTTSRQIHFLFVDGTRRDIQLPDDRVVVSVAPYIHKTHPCRDHTPSSCRGELADTDITVKVATADGRTVLDEKTATLPNGFVDLWLPRGETLDVTIQARGLTATQRIGTADSDPTCITTMELHP